MMVHCLPCERYLKLLKNNSAIVSGLKTSTETDTETNTETDTEKRILLLISKKPTITIQQMADESGLSLSGVRYVLKKLREKGMVDREGAQKNGRWIVRV